MLLQKFSQNNIPTLWPHLLNRNEQQKNRPNEKGQHFQILKTLKTNISCVYFTMFEIYFNFVFYY